MSEETHMHSSHSGGSSASNLLPYSILIAALIIGGSMVFAANTINGGLLKVGALAPTTGTNVPTAQVPDPTAGQTPPQTFNVTAIAGNGPVLGNANAPITMVEFSDFQCPFCGRFYNDSFAQLKKDYIDTGKVKLVYRHFPLSFHPYAEKGAEAAVCAGKQNKFWEMHDKLFESQATLTNHFSTESDPTKALAAVVTDIKGYAVGLGLNATQFNQCLDNGDAAAEVQSDYTQGTNYSVTGTPTFYIGSGANGKQVVGAQPYSVFKSAIDDALKNAA